MSCTGTWNSRFFRQGRRVSRLPGQTCPGRFRWRPWMSCRACCRTSTRKPSRTYGARFNRNTTTTWNFSDRRSGARCWRPTGICCFTAVIWGIDFWCGWNPWAPNQVLVTFGYMDDYNVVVTPETSPPARYPARLPPTIFGADHHQVFGPSFRPGVTVYLLHAERSTGGGSLYPESMGGVRDGVPHQGRGEPDGS